MTCTVADNAINDQIEYFDCSHYNHFVMYIDWVLSEPENDKFEFDFPHLFVIYI